MSTFWTKADRFPPILVRLLAKHSGHNGRAFGAPVTNAELAERTGLEEIMIIAMSRKFDWTGIDLPTMRKFLAACEVDFEDPVQMKRAQQYMRGRLVRLSGKPVRMPPTFDYLRQHEDWPKFYLPLATKFLQRRK